MNRTKDKVKEQIKTDKMRLKELRKLDKQNALSEEETWEYVRLMNENIARMDKQTGKLQKVAFVFLGLSGLMEIVALIVTILTALKH